MDTNTSSTDDARQTLFDTWHEEHQQLDAFSAQLRKWAYDIAQIGIPHFGETADKLTQLRVRLVEHFAREDEIGRQLANDPGFSSLEVNATHRQAAADHDQLLQRLDGLTARLNQTEPPFDSWEQAFQEVERLMDAIDQHEAHEDALIIASSRQDVRRH